MLVSFFHNYFILTHSLLYGVHTHIVASSDHILFKHVHVYKHIVQIKAVTIHKQKHTQKHGTVNFLWHLHTWDDCQKTGL